MAEACPKCGAAEREAGGVGEGSEDRLWECGRLHRVIDGRVWDMIETEECRRRQLAQRDERIKELESGLAALAPVVRAAERVVGAYGRGPLAGRLGLDLHHDTNGLIGAFCALTPEQRARLEEP